jgi:2-hydroxy-3-keto-5-methylthiopentenyl-1-phosphate phosphatase
MKPQVLVDFDGTIVKQDATDLILERFALPEWRDVEQEWVGGAIGSRECLSRQINLVRATPRQMDGLIREIDIDPAFSAFTRLCHDRGYFVLVASDGLDRVIATTLRRARIDVPFASNRLVHTGKDRWRVEFPHFRGTCGVASGTCKCALPDPTVGLTILVGDGRSDFCAAGQAKWVLAKGALAQHCQKNGIPHTVIGGFTDAIEAFRKLAQVMPAPAVPQQSHETLAGAPHA